MNNLVEIAIGTAIITVGLVLTLAAAAYVIDFLFFKKKR
jgi:hypothetical protein|tara:strand:+ start:131 stop:247 length:117 start_codon:yes stop_codon:yes gene_type:complete